MPVFFRSRAGRQCLLLVALGGALWAIGAMLEFGDWLAAFVSAFDSYGADKLVLALAVGGTMSFVYSVLRIADLRREMELRARAEARADWTATHDHLTKLPNRYAFERKVVRKGPADPDAISEDWERNVTIFCVDLDGFKKVNDLIGHNGGDALLIEVSKRICAIGRADCVYRFGGDEFIIVATGLSDQHEERFARLLIQAVTRPVYIDGSAVEVGASVGYDRWAQESEPLEHAAHRSDLAMYEAKSRGPNHYLAFQASMRDKVALRASLEAKLRIAIQKKSILPFYQPLIDLKTSNVCGFEALARWTDDDGANISPLVFIAIAEETGLITALFEDLLAQACRDALAWDDHLTLSFNVSPVQMEDRLLTTRIFKALAATTENALIQDPASAAAILEELHRAGVQIALDDFGTGYSSLAQLARYRFDKIKIDKSFIATYRDDERQEKIVRAMLGLGRSLNIQTTAEGIEEQRQLSHLIQLGCDIGQGYLFGRPMPAEETLSFLANRDLALAAG